MTEILEVLLDSWDRNNTILVNLLQALPEGGLETRAMDRSPSVAQMFTHIHFVRLVFISEDAPEFARELPEEEWADERDPARMARLLNESANAVRDTVKSQGGDRRRDEGSLRPPDSLLQQMIWHDGYHHGQIKLALSQRAAQ